MTETLSFWSFLRKFVLNMGALMSGGFSVPLTFLAIFFPNAPLRLLFGGLAGIGFVGACYLVWRDSLRAAQATITELSGVIAERDETIRKLSEKPPRSPAEQHDYETASAALKLLGDNGKTALRFLRQRGSITYALPVPHGAIPPGMNMTETMWVYNHCASEGVITCEEKQGSGVKTFSIPPNMAAVLEELLFQKKV